jgi:tetratricopeptide (TPR) repeat protein
VEPLEQSATGYAIAQASGQGATAAVTIINGIPPEQLQQWLIEGTLKLPFIEDLSRQLNITQEAVRGFLNILNTVQVPTEELPSVLANIAQRYCAMLERLSVLDSDNKEISAYIEQARTLLSKAETVGDYDRADSLLAKAEEVDLREVRKAEDLAKEAMAAVEKKRRSAAAIRAERAELSLTRQNYLAAGQHYLAAANLLGPEEIELRARYRHNQAFALVQFGEHKGDNAALADAAEICRSILSEISRDQMLLVWVAAQRTLGISLQALGRRENGSQRLDEALQAFELLGAATKEAEPLEWAKTQINIGNTLKLLADRLSDKETLEKAAAAYELGLTLLTPDSSPFEWAAGQSNLGGTLTSLGERESGTSRLVRAVTILCEALKYQTREKFPMEWATTQNNLGTALAVLGRREVNTTRLYQAVDAFREALKERTHGRLPLRWAMTKTNLANARKVLGELERSTEILQEAISTFREALQVRTRDRWPQDWARTQLDLAGALGTLGHLNRHIENLQEAINTFSEAFEVLTKEAEPFQWAVAQANLGNVCLLLGRRDFGIAPLEFAVVAFDNALSVFEPHNLPQTHSCRAKRGEAACLLWLKKDPPSKDAPS